MEQWLNTLDWQWQAIFRLCIACVLGGMVGIERQHHGREAGFRTQLLVALGSALTMVVSLNVAKVFGQPGVSEVIRLDPARIAYGVMVGIGFLGAGAIIKDGTTVRGLTTAASLWCTAAIGLACGFGMFPVAIGATVLVLAALVVLGAVENRAVTRWHKDVIVVIDPTPDRNSITILQETLASHGVKTFDIGYARDLETGLETVTLSVTVAADRSRDEMAYWLKEVPKVKRITVQ